MPIILVCGDKNKIGHFCSDFKSHLDENVKIHDSVFNESISDVIEDDVTLNHIITTSLYKPERYITFCNSKRFKTSYVVIFLNGKEINEDLEIPKESTRHDNPLLSIEEYEKEDKKAFFANLKDILVKKIIKKSYSNQKNLKDHQFLKNVQNIVKNVQLKYKKSVEHDILIETEKRMMAVLSNNRIKLDEVEKCYEEILRNALADRHNNY